MSVEIQRYGRYECRVKLRPTYQGLPLKSSALALDGTTLVCEARWLMGEAEKYPGEWALQLPADIARRTDICWIASGDVDIVKEVAE